MDAHIFPEDGIVEVTFEEEKPHLADGSYYINWNLTYDKINDLYKQAFPTVVTPLTYYEETPVQVGPKKKKGPSMHSTRKQFEKPHLIK